MKNRLFLKDISSELLLETMAEGALIINTDGFIEVWNKAMIDMTGYSKSEAIGKHINWLRVPNCHGAKKILSLLNSEETEEKTCVNSCECKIITKSGGHIPVLVNARVIISNSGETIGILQTLTDFRTVQVLRQEIEAMTLKLHGEGNFQGIIGRSLEMQKVFKMTTLAAESDATVIVLGDSGTGKELVASAIHGLSPRKNSNLIRVNCGAIPETLLESELFGHEKGSFTGAYKKRIGRFELADNGTIFLDEIGDISHTMQIKLLRVLQEGEFERVGGEKTINVNVRVIAATHKNLLDEVKAGRFREDLYYRLRVFPIHIPILRKRPTDIPLLVQHFINKFSAKTGKLITGIKKHALDILCSYQWPGNVRELENAIEYAFVVCQNKLISKEDIPEEIVAKNDSSSLDNNKAIINHTDISSLEAKRIVRSKQKLTDILEECLWNKAEVGRKLNLSRTAIWKWMKKHGIPLKANFRN